MYSLTLHILFDAALFSALKVEEESLSNKRATTSITQCDDKIQISLNAKDFVSFRAIETSIMRLLVTYNKMLSIGD